MSKTTLHGDADSLLSLDASEALVPALTVLWSRSEPARVGEVVLVDRPGTLGREGGLPLVRQRPGRNARTGPLSAERLSREQLRLTPRGSQIEVDNVGRRGLQVNGQAHTSARVSAGDVLELERELLLLVELRPRALPPAPCDHAFGEPDADGVVGESVAAWELRRRLAFVGARVGHVLLLGASGSGKELAARAVHRLSGRHGPLVARNAATFPETLLDAELFGNRADYPNPGMPARAGAVGEADGGTLFLDEIGEVSHAMQAHLLRVLDAGEYQRLGDAGPRRADLRAVGATNRALDALKHDLLARFDHRIQLPDLAARRADIPLLAQHFLRDMAASDPSLFADRPRLHPRFVSALVRYRFTTHARELRQLLWRAAAASSGKYLDLPLDLAPPPKAERDPGSLTKDEILAAYRLFDGVQARVPAHLGLRDRFQLGRLEKKLGITAADKAAAVKG
jgi:two-component system nitrogen regulation response regulator GlnG/two-component system response regulator HydG